MKLIECYRWALRTEEYQVEGHALLHNISQPHSTISTIQNFNERYRISFDFPCVSLVPPAKIEGIATSFAFSCAGNLGFSARLAGPNSFRFAKHPTQAAGGLLAKKNWMLKSVVRNWYKNLLGAFGIFCDFF